MYHLRQPAGIIQVFVLACNIGTGPVSIPAIVPITRSEVAITRVPQTHLPCSQLRQLHLLGLPERLQLLLRCLSPCVACRIVFFILACDSEYLWISGYTAFLTFSNKPPLDGQCQFTSHISQMVLQSPERLRHTNPLQCYLRLTRETCGREQRRKYQAL